LLQSCPQRLTRQNSARRGAGHIVAGGCARRAENLTGGGGGGVSKFRRRRCGGRGAEL